MNWIVDSVRHPCRCKMSGSYGNVHVDRKVLCFVLFYTFLESGKAQVLWSLKWKNNIYHIHLPGWNSPSISSLSVLNGMWLPILATHECFSVLWSQKSPLCTQKCVGGSWQMYRKKFLLMEFGKGKQDYGKSAFQIRCWSCEKLTEQTDVSTALTGIVVAHSNNWGSIPGRVTPKTFKMVQVKHSA